MNVNDIRLARDSVYSPDLLIGNLRIVTYDENIGVNLCTEAGHTIKQVAYYNKKLKKWFKNDGSDGHAYTPMEV